LAKSKNKEKDDGKVILKRKKIFDSDDKEDEKEESEGNNSPVEKNQSEQDEKNEKYLKASSVLLLFFAIALLVSLISYSRGDESIARSSFSELIGLFSPDAGLRFKAESAENWLGLLGSVFSFHLYNSSLGIIALSLPFLIFLLSRDLFLDLSISRLTGKRFGLFLVYTILFSGFFGSIRLTEFGAGLPKEFPGNLGMFLAFSFQGFLGIAGSIFLFFTGIIALTILGTEIKLDKIFTRFYSETDKSGEHAGNLFSKIKDVTGKINLDSILKKETKTKEIKEEIIEEKEEDLNKNEESKVEQTKIEIKKSDLGDEEHSEDLLHKSMEISSINITLSPQEDLTSSFEQTYGKEDEEVNNQETENENKLDKENPDINLSFDNPENKPEDEAILVMDVEDEVEPEELSTPLSTLIHDEKIRYSSPHFNLISDPIKVNEVEDDELKNNGRILQEKLETFKILIENLQVTPGPVVTQYAFTPAAGIKISRIESLSDDLAMALKARGIRIIAPIPGKGAVGVEIPNANPSMVNFSSIIRSRIFQEARKEMFLPMALGKTISGEVAVADLAKMPHMLIAGATGSGKSVGVNTIICSLLYGKRPDELKFVIIDPKKVELQQYSALKDHFLAVSPDIRSKIVTDPVEAIAILKSTVIEMENRYDILAAAGQRNIADYNKKVREGKYKNSSDIEHRAMPYIVVIVDEFADLMLTAGKEVEEPIVRLAQMARAIGIHIVLATQRPSVDVITGIIKANFPARIAFQVASKIDSRTILDMMGAEKLLGNGDMLFFPSGKPKPERVQNAFISTEEVEAICDYIGDQKGYSEPYFLPSIHDVDGGGSGSIASEDRDPLFEDAAHLVISTQQGSVSMIQRRLKVGYARAGRMMDELEDAGVVGPFEGSKARSVLMESISELNSIL
jgi:DNA segregation ATPase FtsK/SpoIIIE, S-DNA-T family